MLGSVTSAVARLTVMDPAITVQPASQNLEPGQSVTFSVTAAGTAPFGYQWWKTGRALARADQRQSCPDRRDHQRRCRPLCGGGEQSYGSVTSAVALLTVRTWSQLDTGFNPGRRQ